MNCIADNNLSLRPNLGWDRPNLFDVRLGRTQVQQQKRESAISSHRPNLTALRLGVFYNSYLYVGTRFGWPVGTRFLNRQQLQAHSVRPTSAIRLGEVGRSGDSYTDFQVHYEDCPHCRRDRPCPAGERAKQRDDDSPVDKATLRALLASMNELL